MFRNVVPAKQLSAWLAAALIPGLLQLAGGTNWVTALTGAAACSVALGAVCKWGRRVNSPMLLWLQYLYIIVLLCTLMPGAAYSWPGDNDPAVPLILLALAAWSSCKGARATACVGCVLFWLVLGIYLFVLALGTGEIRTQWLQPGEVAFCGQGFALLLIPCGAVLSVGEQGACRPRYFLPAVMWVGASIVIAGILSPTRANELADPWYTVVKSMVLPGTTQRFEALISAGMTVGWFCLATVLLSMAASQIERLNPAWGKKALLAGAVLAGGGMLCNMHISWRLATILATVFWVAIPVLTQGLVRLKKM